jgi:hypothetical protein
MAVQFLAAMERTELIGGEEGVAAVIRQMSKCAYSSRFQEAFVIIGKHSLMAGVFLNSLLE